MISIIDYGIGNLGSIQKKLRIVGAESIITSSPEEIRKSTKIILPGVGHFANAVCQIKERKLWDVLNEEVIIKKKDVLGICLGMQLMAKFSEEGNVDGFGWIDANVTRFSLKDKLRHKIPHIGWNTVFPLYESRLFEGCELYPDFYFVHSYHINCNKREDILSETDYEIRFISAIQHDNIFGVQFHPEKSHHQGEILLRNFLNF